MNDLRAAARQALQALESLFSGQFDPELGMRCGNSVLALKAALAQQEEQVLEAKSLAGILLREHDNAEQAIQYAERMAQRYADSRSTMAMEYIDAAQELKAWTQNKHR